MEKADLLLSRDHGAMRNSVVTDRSVASACASGTSTTCQKGWPQQSWYASGGQPVPTLSCAGSSYRSTATVAPLTRMSRFTPSWVKRHSVAETRLASPRMCQSIFAGSDGDPSLANESVMRNQCAEAEAGASP